MRRRANELSNEVRRLERERKGLESLLASERQGSPMVAVSPERRALVSIPVDSPMWSRLEHCRDRCLRAGKLDLLPVIFALEYHSRMSPPEAEWRRYGESLPFAFSHLAQAYQYKDTAQSALNRAQIESEHLRTLYGELLGKYERTRLALSKMRIKARLLAKKTIPRRHAGR